MRCHADRKVAPLRVASRDFCRLTDYGLTGYGYYGCRRMAVCSVLAQVGYGIGLVDDAVGDALAERVADGGAVWVKAVRRNLRRPKQPLAKIADKQVRVLAVALAGVIGEDGLSRGRNRNKRVLVAFHGDIRSRDALLLVPNVLPQLVTFDSGNTKSDQHSVVQFRPPFSRRHCHSGSKQGGRQRSLRFSVIVRRILKHESVVSRRALLGGLASLGSALALGGCADLSATGTRFDASSLSDNPKLLVATTRKPANGGRAKPWFGPERASTMTLAIAKLVPPDDGRLSLASVGLDNWRLDAVEPMSGDIGDLLAQAGGGG